MSYKWLREYVPVEQSPEELAELLTMAGLEVDSVIDFGAAYLGLRPGQVISVEPHPRAAQLLVCKIRLSDGEVTVVTAATNLKAGIRCQLRCLVLPLPDGKVIQPAEFQGIVSQGMLCSEEELGLARKSGGIMVLLLRYRLKADLATILGLDDHVLVLELTPTGPIATDAKSGVEVAALTEPG